MPIRIIRGNSYLLNKVRGESMVALRVYYSTRMLGDSSGSGSPSASKPKQVAKDWLENNFDIDIKPPSPCNRKDMYEAHDKAYVDAVLDADRTDGFGLKRMANIKSFPYTSGAMYAAARYCLKCSQSSCAALCSGFHHAGWDFGGGYCTFNGLIIAAMKLKKNGLASKVGILDLDQHYGNGTDQIINKLRLDYIQHYSAGGEYSRPDHAKEFLKKLPEIVKKFKGCDIILVQFGADPHIDDPLGGFLTTNQLKKRDQIVFQGCADLNIPVAWNLAGGYQKDKDGGIKPILDIHRNTVITAIKALKVFKKNRGIRSRFRKKPISNAPTFGERLIVHSVRFTIKQDRLLSNYVNMIERNTGEKVTYSWVVNELINLGVKPFETKHIYHQDLQIEYDGFKDDDDDEN